MSNVIKIKRSQISSSPITLEEGELGYSELSDNLFIGKSGSNIGIIGGHGTFAKIDSEIFTGTPTAPTASKDTNTDQIATTAFVKNQIVDDLISNDHDLVLSAAKGKQLQDEKAPIASPNLSGVPTAPTALKGTNTNQIATTAFVRVEVDSAKQGLDTKDSVRVASTEPILNLSNCSVSQDDVTLVEGDRILVKDGASADGIESVSDKRNGIYVVGTVSAGFASFTRSIDADNSDKVNANLYVWIEDGTINGDNGYTLTTNDPITLDITPLSFTQFNGAGQIIAGTGLTKNGNTLNVIGTSDRIFVDADTIDIASTYTGQTSINTLGTITTGVWNGDTLSVSYGGTGISSVTEGAFLKGNGSGALVEAVLGVDFLNNSSDIDGGTF